MPTNIRPVTIDIHYNDVIMGEIASQITNLTIVYSTVYSDADQRKHQSSASLALVRGIHRGPVNSPHKWQVKRKMIPFDDVIMIVRFSGCRISRWREISRTTWVSQGAILKVPHSVRGTVVFPGGYVGIDWRRSHQRRPYLSPYHEEKQVSLIIQDQGGAHRARLTKAYDVTLQRYHNSHAKI